ncbi:MAG TPA: glucose-6-phosphate dehydrogenase [Acidobacteriota bacterium]|jgi:glucose-6-phosphate 1-dehydrogenase|nr:glucose-6-phosphate dehydrogenase [Acidobacteriota bacterium]
MATAVTTPPDHQSAPFSEAAGPCAMVLFGASGDLTKRKLAPALFNLAKVSLLPKNFAILGVAIEQLGDEQFRTQVSSFLPAEDRDTEAWDWFQHRLYYQCGDFADPGTYSTVASRLSQLDQQYQTEGNYLFYLATSPKFFASIIEKLGITELSQQQNGRWRRVIIEKPFGHDYDSARALNRQIKAVLAENQIYRIDHYLGKETVQNILVFRFDNSIFEPIWNRRYIDHVQITNAETVGVEQRGGYFDTAGTLRDMVPNHVMQLLSLIAMESPVSFHADAVRNEQAKVLHAMQPLASEDVLQCSLRGQYAEGFVGDERVPAYRTEPGVSSESRTETFVALKLNIDNWRWVDVPFYLRTGKRLAKRHTEIAIQFKKTPFVLFRNAPVHKHSNQLVIQIQPVEGISLSFGAKIPGPILRVGSVDMSFEYSKYFGAAAYTGYEVLLYDCMIGDATLFQRADMVEAGWSVVDPVLDVWKALPPRRFPNYAAGTWGPKECDDLLQRDGREWRKIE